MEQLNEDYTAGVLKGVPLFCVNRLFEATLSRNNIFLKAQYHFKFDNGYGASIVEFVNSDCSGGQHYELAPMKYDGNSRSLCELEILNFEIERGDERYMHEVLCMIEKLEGSL